MFQNAFGTLQRIGRALMLPVAMLPAAGILLAFGNAMQNPDMIAVMPFLKLHSLEVIATLMENAGNIIFTNLPLIFAIGVALGLANGDGVAGLAAVIGFLIMNVTMGVMSGVEANMIGGNPAYAEVLGIPTLQTGVFGGIIAGVLGAVMYNRYYTIELPSYLGFFAGKRFVPIATAVGGLVLGIALNFLWPTVQHGLNSFSYFMTESNPTLAAFIFGVIERALIPFGLHHIFYSPFWFEFGSYVNKAGEMIHGDQRIFFAQIKDGVPFTAGTFMTGKFPFMMFGLPGAALAIYHCANPENKKYVAGLMSSAALTSFLTGVTEPIEFSFLFVAPILFGIHTIFAGLSFMIMHLLNVKIGMTLSGGFIDFFLFGILPNRTEWWLVIPVGLCFAVVYYFGFRFAIKKFNLMTPGREEKENDRKKNYVTSSNALPYEILVALGGKENLSQLDACITRLRITVKDKSQVDKERLKDLGASGVLEVGNNIQAIFGPQADGIKTQMQDIINGRVPSELIPEKSDSNSKKEPDLVINPAMISLEFISPTSGEIMPITKTPDDVFAGKMMGDGFAIEPSDGTFVSPVDGQVINIFPTKHAIGIRANNGYEILLHIGIDTVTMEGEGFEVFVAEGEKIKQGQLLVKADLTLIRKKAKSTITPIVFTNLSDESVVRLNSKGKVNIKDKIITIEKKDSSTIA